MNNMNIGNTFKKLDIVGHFLKSNGPSLSSDIAKGLHEQSGFSEAAARKIIQRTRGPVSRLTNIRFSNNKQFLYLSEDYRSDIFWERLLAAFESTNSIYALTIRAVESRGGIVPIHKFGTLSGAPFKLKNQISYERILSNLLTLGLFERINITGVGDCIRFAETSPFESVEAAQLKARMVAEEILLKALSEWVRKNGFGSYEKVQIRTKAHSPVFAHFEWDLTVPSYVKSIATRSAKEVNPGFLVADVNLALQMEDRHIGYFLKKCEIITHQKNNRPFIPFLIAQSFSKAALQKGKSAGYIFTTPDNLLGVGIGAALISLMRTLENAAAVAIKNPDILVDIFSKLGQIEGAAGNLRGALFEMITGHCVQEVEGNTIDIGLPIANSNGEKAEIDVLRVKGKQEVCAYECKGYGPSKAVSEEEIDKWIEKTIPRIFSWIKEQERFNGCAIKFEFWTSGIFLADTVKKLEKHKANTKRYKINWLDGEGVYKYALKTKSTRIKELLKEQYLKHPLASS